MLLSDRDILAELDQGRVQLDPFDAGMVQPSSVDVRLDRYFRVFENHRYPHIDPAEDQPELTREVEPEGDEPFPNRRLLRLLIARGVPITFGSDCHHPGEVAFARARVEALLREVGIAVDAGPQPITVRRGPLLAYNVGGNR